LNTYDYEGSIDTVSFFQMCRSMKNKTFTYELTDLTSDSTVCWNNNSCKTIQSEDSSFTINSQQSYIMIYGSLTPNTLLYPSVLSGNSVVNTKTLKNIRINSVLKDEILFRGLGDLHAVKLSFTRKIDLENNKCILTMRLHQILKEPHFHFKEWLKITIQNPEKTIEINGVNENQLYLDMDIDDMVPILIEFKEAPRVDINNMSVFRNIGPITLKLLLTYKIVIQSAVMNNEEIDVSKEPLYTDIKNYYNTKLQQNPILQDKKILKDHVDYIYSLF